ncbi:MAG: hypothetical protein M1830_006734 [Pleopsidium flavum]|nr:MAG: hypothetical protein M1830_006734 [Pleopsidium flavum]
MAPIGDSMRHHQSKLSLPQNKVAHALAVVKSKPLGVLMRDYILQLRKHTQEGRRQGSTRFIHRHIDSVAFWKDCCNEAIAAQAELKARIKELERVNEILLSKLKPADRPEFEPSGRKKREKSAESSAGDVRRLGTGTGNHPSEARVRDNIAEFEVYGMTAEKRVFMTQLYGFHRLLQDEFPDPRELSSVLLQLCSSAAIIVSSACDTSKIQTGPGSSRTAVLTGGQETTASPSERNLEVELGILFRALGRTFAHLLQGYGKLNKTTESRGYQGQVIFSFVKLFGDILNNLHSVSVTKRQVQPEKLNRSHIPKANTEAPRNVEPETPDKTNDLGIHLCQLLVTMIATLEPAKPGHIDVLEGFFYLLLQRVGKILYVFVFDEEESPILANRDNDEDRLRYHGIGANFQETLKRIAMQEEAKYLIWTLERAMGFVCRSHSVSPTAKGSKGKVKDVSTTNKVMAPDKTNISERAKMRLQNTLLKGIFGVDAKEFKEGLRMPTFAEIDLDAAISTIPEDDTPEWFKQEVWRLLGWEILGQHVDI